MNLVLNVRHVSNLLTNFSLNNPHHFSTIIDKKKRDGGINAVN